MKKSNRIVSFVLCLMLCVSMLFTSNGMSALAAGYDTENGEVADSKTDESSVTVYFTLSNDGVITWGNDENQTSMTRVPLTVSWFDLSEYGLGDFTRHDDNGNVIQKPTVLHAVIRALETYYCPDSTPLEIGTEALTITGSAGSMYMQQFWGHDENLMYYVNHAYPLMYEGWGATADYILLNEGDELDFAMFSDWSFYSYGAFAAFDETYVTARPGDDITLNMYASPVDIAGSNPGSASTAAMPGETVQVSSDLGYAWEDAGTTDENGNITLNFNDEGVYYVSSGQTLEPYVNYPSDTGQPCVAPPYSVIVVSKTLPVPAKTYAVNFNITSGKNTITASSITVKDANGNTVKPSTGNSYKLNDGIYTYSITANGYKTAFGSFTVNGAALTVPIEMTEINLLKNVVFTDNNNNTYLTDFDPDTKEFTITVPDTASSLYVTATLAADAKGAAMTGTYKTATTNTSTGSSKSLNLTSGSKKYASSLISAGSNKNTFTLTAKYGSVSQSYKVNIERSRSLSALTISDHGNALTLSPSFNGSKYNYSVDILDTTTELTVKAATYKTSSYRYSLAINGKEATSGTDTVVPVSEDDNEITIDVLHGDGSKGTYTITLNRKESATVSFLLTPDVPDANIQVFSTAGVKQPVNEDGSYTLMKGCTYIYKILADGYLYNTDSFVAQDMELKINLIKEEKSDDTWADFRGNSNNNGITSAPTPKTADEAELYWATKYGAGWASGAPSSPIIVNGYLYFTSNKSIVKMDKTTGEIVASGTMVTTSAFNITPPTYADGKIFVALAGSRVQAFDAETLESLWVFKSTTNGQPNSPITYHDGYVYTGFWSGETKDCDYVCLSVEDEDPDNPTETKEATWQYMQKGGFYWAGCYVTDNYLLVGTDDGVSGYTAQTSQLLSLDPLTGSVIDSLDGLNADIRSSISRDESTGAFYFTSKGGSFYEVYVNDDGTIEQDSLRTLDLGGMSTSTPVVYNGRAYVGVSGDSQFGAYSGHNITVIDLDSFEIAYTCPTQGYPQTSGLLTTAYEDEDDYCYIYFFDNYTPGKLRVIKDRPGQTSIDDDDTLLYAPVLFTPSGAQSQYALCSPIVDEDGTIYFKNDSAHMMAVGSKITSIEVTSQPDKLTYKEGDLFDSEGMKVVAHYANGLTKDVTNYISYPKDFLTTEDKDITISYPHVLYGDTDDGDNTNDWNNINVTADAPTVTLDITVLTKSDSEKIEEINDTLDTKVTELLDSMKNNDTTLIPDSLQIISSISSIQEFTEKYDILSEEAKSHISDDTLEKIESLKEVVSNTIKEDTASKIKVSDLEKDQWNIGIKVTPVVENDITYSTITVDCGENKILSLYEIDLVNYITDETYELSDGNTVTVTMPAVSYDTSKYKGILVVHKRHDGELEYITPVVNADGTLTFTMDSFSPIGIVGVPLGNSNPNPAPNPDNGNNGQNPAPNPDNGNNGQNQTPNPDNGNSSQNPASNLDNGNSSQISASASDTGSNTANPDTTVVADTTTPAKMITSSDLTTPVLSDDSLADEAKDRLTDEEAAKPENVLSKNDTKDSGNQKDTTVFEKVTSFHVLVITTVLILLLIAAITLVWYFRQKKQTNK